MLLSAHVTSVLFFVRFNNFDRTTGFFLVLPSFKFYAVTRSYSSRSFLCALNFIMFHMWIYFAGVGFWVILATAICTAAKMVA